MNRLVVYACLFCFMAGLSISLHLDSWIAAGIIIGVAAMLPVAARRRGIK